MRMLGLLRVLALWLALGACKDEKTFAPPPGDDDGDDDGAPIDAAPDDGAPIDSAIADAAMPDAIACATAPTGNWAGTSGWFTAGGGEPASLTAVVSWTLAETVGCVDHYRPSGTVTYTHDAQECEQESFTPPSGEIDESEGELIIDRTTSPATYRLQGTTRWESTWRCDDDALEVNAGGQWGFGIGTFDGAVIAGEVDPPLFFPHRDHWRFQRADVTFPPPDGCVEPATEQWAYVAEVIGEGEGPITRANLTWTRVETTDCADRYHASGTLELVPRMNPDCTSVRPSSPRRPGSAGATLVMYAPATRPPAKMAQTAGQFVTRL